MKIRGRFAAVGALVVTTALTGGAAYGDGPVLNTGPVPEEWGEPDVVFAQVTIVGRELGRLPGRLGNQHVSLVSTVDEDSVVTGEVADWWCPAGAIAPTYAAEETPCRLKAHRYVEFDYDRSADLVQSWSPRVRWIVMRIPVELTDSGGALVDEGTVSFQVRATGALSNQWGADDWQDVLTRQGAYVRGGKFMGKPWLEMDSAEVVYDQMWLLRYYNP